MFFEIILLLLRDKWPAEREQPDLLEGTHVRFGFVVLHEDIHYAQQDSHNDEYAQQDSNIGRQRTVSNTDVDVEHWIVIQLVNE